MTMLQSALREQEVRRAASWIADGDFLVIHGPWPTEAAAVASAALASTDIPVAWVAVGACADDADLARAFVRAVAGALVGEPRLLDLPTEQLKPDQARAAQRLRRALVARADAGADDDPAEPTPAPVAATVGAVLPLIAAQRAVLVLEDADALVAARRFSQGNAVLWAIRSVAQRGARLGIVLTGGPSADALSDDPEQAFLGWGRSIYLERPSHDRMVRALEDLFGERFPGRVLDEVAMASEGAPWAAEAIVERLYASLALRESGDYGFEWRLGARPAWHALVEASAESLDATSRLVGELHRAAYAVCQALAWDRPPYSVASASDVNRAINALHAKAIIERAGPRSWRLCNPLFAEWLRVTTASLR